MITAVDSKKKAPVSLRVSVTDGCQLKCAYCMPDVRNHHMPENGLMLSYEEIGRFVDFLMENFQLEKVRITGGEPLLRDDIDQLVRILSHAGVPDIALTTNGLRLKEQASLLKESGLHRVNVSLDSLLPSTLQRLTGAGNLDAIVDGIKEASAVGLQPLKLNAVIISGVNDNEVNELLSFSIENDCILRFIELMPIGPGAGLFEEGFISSETLLQHLSKEYDLVPAAHMPGSSSRLYKATDARGESGIVGFISPCSMPFCGDCTRLRLTSEGVLMGCLAKSDGENIGRFLKDGDMDPLGVVVNSVLQSKRSDNSFAQDSAMVEIGG